jgi:hypothetical protein
VKIEGPFNQFDRVPGAAVFPIDANGTASANSAGTWIILIRPPWQIGKLKPTHAAISLDIDAPQHNVTIQAGQFAGGTQSHFVANPAAPALATWNRAVGHRTVSFDIAPGDCSADGLLAICVTVESPEPNAISESAPPPWAMRDVQVALDAQVIDGPIEPALPVEVPDETPAAVKAAAKRAAHKH